MYSISISTIIMFGRLSEFAEYHESTISGSADDGFMFIWIVDGRIRHFSRTGRASGDAWKKIIKYDINGNFTKLICSPFEEGNRKKRSILGCPGKISQISGAIIDPMPSEILAGDQ
jgi:hypothetical protein